MSDAPADGGDAEIALAHFVKLRDRAAVLEVQLAARTRALADANARLQAEVAARERTEAALHQAQKLYAAGQLAGGIAHDFNNTLATIMGCLELMERGVQTAAIGAGTADHEQLFRLIERAIDAVQRGARLTGLLHAFSRRQSGTVRPTDLNRLIGDLMALAGGTLGRGVRVQSDLAADLWHVLADPGHVGAALLALCLNARDAMPKGGDLTITTANAHVILPASDGLAPGDYVRVTVSDTGCGMVQEVLAQAFEPFFSTKGPAAAGLGLSHVHGLARQSGGGVRAASTPGRGTAVVLLLPRAPGQT